MKKLNYSCVLISMCLFATIIFSGNQSAFVAAADPIQSKLVLLIPCDEIHNDYPVMQYLPDTLSIYRDVHDAFENSFLKHAHRLYSLSQRYASHLEIVEHPESMYLAITKNEGGYAKRGFYLDAGGKLIDKTNIPYIDITEKAAAGKLSGLMSLTQLFPHELGHVLYHMFSDEDSLSYNNHSVDMHYFSVITDYPTAFNEGFAEHMENISRLGEENQSIKAGIEKDIQRIEILTAFSRKKFKRDLRIRLRIGFYKATMVNWFQKYEDLKRYSHAMDGTIKFRSTTPDFPQAADRITYRNTALEWDPSKLRNKVQSHSTEGMICSFFTSLTRSELGLSYRDSAFYSAFRRGDEVLQLPMEALLSPTENMFVKYFYVFHTFMLSNNSKKSQLIDFIEGYITSFPDESQVLLEIYSEVFGEAYSPSLPPPVWLLVKNYKHRLLTLDAYGAITIPFYTFDLNAAEPEDLLTIKGLSEENAREIIEYRDKNGLFDKIPVPETWPGVDPRTCELLHQHAFNQQAFEEGVEAYEANIQIGRLFIKPLLDLGLKTLIYLLLFYLVYYLLLSRGRKKTYLRWIFSFTGHYLLWILVVLSGIFAVFAFNHPMLMVLVLHALLLSSSCLIYRKDRKNRNFSMGMQLSLLLIMVFSLI